MSRIATAAVVTVLSLGVSALPAQSRVGVPGAGSLDLSLVYSAQRTASSSTQAGAWLQGGAVEFGATVWHGWGVLMDASGEHTASVGSGGIPYSVVAVTFGPRYVHRVGRKVTVYGKALVGEANAFDSIIPGAVGTQASTNSIALLAGGGADYRWTRHLRVRLVDAAWSHTQIANGSDNLQNDVRLSSGVVYCFGR